MRTATKDLVVFPGIPLSALVAACVVLFVQNKHAAAYRLLVVLALFWTVFCVGHAIGHLTRRDVG